MTGMLVVRWRYCGSLVLMLSWVMLLLRAIKPGPLTLEERVEMVKHVRYGLEIISQSQILQEATAVVGGHHECYDGTGYPLGLKGEAIPREARLFALVDVFDALLRFWPKVCSQKEVRYIF